MVLRSLKENPAKAVPVAMMFVCVDMMLVVFGIVWPRFDLNVVLFGYNWSEFLLGVLFGVAIVFEVLAVALAVAAARGRGEKA